MPVIVKNTGTGDFTPAPIGLHRGVCCDVVELGYLETPWGKKRKIDLKVQIAADMDDGKPFIVSKRYTASLFEKANLCIDLESWRGRPFTDEEAADFNLEVLIDAHCQVNIVHNKTETSVFANVAAIVPPAKGGIRLSTKGYTRVCEREGYVEPVTEEPSAYTEQRDDDKMDKLKETVNNMDSGVDPDDQIPF